MRERFGCRGMDEDMGLLPHSWCNCWRWWHTFSSQILKWSSLPPHWSNGQLIVATIVYVARLPCGKRLGVVDWTLNPQTVEQTKVSSALSLLVRQTAAYDIENRACFCFCKFWCVISVTLGLVIIKLFGWNPVLIPLCGKCNHPTSSFWYKSFCVWGKLLLFSHTFRLHNFVCSKIPTPPYRHIRHDNPWVCCYGSSVPLADNHKQSTGRYYR